MIYFLRDGQGHIKIGTTVRLSERKCQLESEVGEPLEVVGVMGGSYREESALHRRFADHNIVNEWFEPHADLLAFIEENAAPWDGVDEKPQYAIAKIDALVMRDARVVVASTGEKLADYLSRLLAPIVASDRDTEMARRVQARSHDR